MWGNSRDYFAGLLALLAGPRLEMPVLIGGSSRPIHRGRGKSKGTIRRQIRARRLRDS